MFNMGKATVTFDRPFWRDKGFSGTAQGGSFFDITWDNSHSGTYAIAGFLTGGDGGGDSPGSLFEPARTVDERILGDIAKWFGEEGKTGVVTRQTWDASAMYVPQPISRTPPASSAHRTQVRARGAPPFRAPQLRRDEKAAAEERVRGGHGERGRARAHGGRGPRGGEGGTPGVRGDRHWD